MRIVFIGAVEFSHRALQKLLSINAQVVGVCTLQESAFNADHVDLTPLCDANRIPCCNTPDINSPEVLRWIRQKEPDVIFCFGWSKLIKQELLLLPPMGIVGFHPAALPANRGRHPLVWALALGLKKTASTFFFMDLGADSGDILSQVEVNISEDDDAEMLYDKVSAIAMAQIEEFFPLLSSGSYPRIAQDHSKANVWRKRGPKDGTIDWRMSAEAIYNLVRALAKPYIGAHFMVNGKEVKVWKSAVEPYASNNIEPGKVIGFRDSAPLIKCGKDALILSCIDPVIQLSEGAYL